MARTSNQHIRPSLLQWLKENFYTRKMNSVPGWIVMGLIGATLGLLAVAVDSKIPIMIAAGFVGIFGVLIILRFPEVGFYVSILASAFIAMPERLGIGGGPLGLMIEAITYLSFLAIIAKQYRERVKVSDFWQNPISVMFILII
ncbi:MAG: hypothetical protein H7Y27_16220, partial [Gemmatimonadaceae bacterium]|nr:hypothetical protein [Chitinophagaceae bacterium]